jgi:hypothetical protein
MAEGESSLADDRYFVILFGTGHTAHHPLAAIPASMTASRNRTGSFRSNFDKSGCSASDPKTVIPFGLANTTKVGIEGCTPKVAEARKQSL